MFKKLVQGIIGASCLILTAIALLDAFAQMEAEPVPVTPVPTATPVPPTATPAPVCADSPYVYSDGWCHYNCNQRYCNGKLVSNTCGAAHSCCQDVPWLYHDGNCYYNCTTRYCAWGATTWCAAAHYCNYCSGVQPYQQCRCSGGIIAGYYNWPGRLNYFIYGRDGKQVCYSESCLRCKNAHSFDPEAKVMLANRSFKVVKDLNTEDKLISPNGRPVSIKQILQSEEESPLFEIKAAGKSLKVTRLHVVWTTQGLKQAQNLRAGDIVKLADGSLKALESVSELPLKLNQKAYGIMLDVSSDNDDDYLMIGEGFVVGDYTLETKVAEIEKAKDRAKK